MTASLHPYAPERPVAIGAIVAAHLVLTVALAASLNIWVDEAYSLHTSGGTLAEAWSRALAFELQPPAYFVLLCLWRSLSATILHARLLSVACTGGAVLLAAPLARRYAPGVPPAVAAALVAFNPLTVWAAVEIRLYALALLLSALLLLFFHDGYLRATPRLRDRVAHAAVGLVALYTQYYLGLLLAAGAMALLVLRRYRPLRGYVAWMIGVGLLFGPMILVVGAQVSAHTGTVATRLSLLYAARLVAWRIQNYALPAAALPEIGQWLVFGSFVLVLAALFVKAALSRSWSAAEGAMLALAGTVAAEFYLVLHITGEELFTTKHTVALFLPILFSMAIVVGRGAGRNGILAWTALAGIGYASLLAVSYRPLAKDGDAARVAAAIAARERPGQAILVFNPQSALPLAAYYHGPNRIVAVPRPMALQTFDVRELALHDEGEVWSALGGRPEAGQEIWLFTHGPRRYLDVSLGTEVLEALVQTNFDVLEDTPFYKARLRLLRAR